MPTSTHIRLAPVAILVLALVGATGLHSSPATARSSSLAPYSWPVKPFDRQHPIRGSFGDPRTVFAGPPTQRTLFSGTGAFSFHAGVDISAPDGTAVYPVESGTVKVVMKDWIQVDSGNGRSFQYWHIASTVSIGQHVAARSTVLGHILRSCGHVHLTEMDGTEPTNPLAVGHLTPYDDTSVPVTSSISFRAGVAGHDLMPELLRGRVEILADVHDVPTLQVPGIWRDLPVTPALIAWRIQRAGTSKAVVPTRTVYDVREHLPAFEDFWRIYARGTHQNMAVFGRHYSYMQPGVYLFRLTPGGFDTRTLPDAVYDLIVTATDIRGNHSSTTQRFSVHNRTGVVGV